ncbi:MAG: contractile injection system protein, VgrG/Pvc8 family [Pseudomonadota bacterium]
MRPIYQITVDGQDITAQIADRLTTLTVIDEAGFEADRLDFTLDNRQGLIERPRRGVKLELALGFIETGMTRIGSFIVDSLSGGGPNQIMNVSAKAVDLTGGIRAPRTEGWTEVTLDTVVTTIARRHQLTPVIAPILAPHFYPHIAQTAESDLNLVTRLAHELSAIAKVAEDRLVVVPPGTQATAAGQPIPPIALDRSAFTSWQWRLGERQDYGSVKAWWQDIAGGRRQPVTAGSGEPIFEIRETFATAEAANRAAAGKLKTLGRDTVEVSGTLAIADLRLAAELPIQLSGFDDGSNGAYTLTRVTHRLSSALTTSFNAKPPAEEE